MDYIVDLIAVMRLLRVILSWLEAQYSCRNIIPVKKRVKICACVFKAIKVLVCVKLYLQQSWKYSGILMTVAVAKVRPSYLFFKLGNKLCNLGVFALVLS